MTKGNDLSLFCLYNKSTRFIRDGSFPGCLNKHLNISNRLTCSGGYNTGNLCKNSLSCNQKAAYNYYETANIQKSRKAIRGKNDLGNSEIAFASQVKLILLTNLFVRKFIGCSYANINR